MNSIKIGRRVVGDGERVFIIAEAGINHNGSLEIAKKLVDAAVDAGVDAIKFQKRDVKSMLTKSAYEKPYTNGGNSFGRTYGEHREKLELSEADFYELKRYADEKGIIFFASPWDEKSADLLDTLDVPVYKIGSPDLTNIPLCTYIAKKGKPIILSTGMSEMWEVEEAVKAITKYNSQLILMHCISMYPAPFEELRLNCINILQSKFGVPVGYSGHESGWVATIAAVSLGALVVEKHITFDRNMKGGDHKFSLEPLELKEMVTNIRNVERSLIGFDKYLLQGEIPFRQKLGKSIVLRKKVKKGTILKKDMLTCKSPAEGVSPMMIENIVGKPVTADLNEDDILHGSDLKLRREAS